MLNVVICLGRCHILWLSLLLMQIFKVTWLLNGIQIKWLYTLDMHLVNQLCLVVPNPRPQRHLDPLKWRWSWSIWMMKSKTQSGRTPLVLMLRNAGWVSTTAILSPHASTLPLPLSATARGDTQEMAHNTATKRKGVHLNMRNLVLVWSYAVPFPFDHKTCCYNYEKCGILNRCFFIPHIGATMSVVRVCVVEAHGLSVNVPSGGRLIQPLWFSVVSNVM